MNKTYYYILENIKTKEEEIEVLDYEIGGKGDIIFFNNDLFEIVEIIVAEEGE